MIGTSKTNRRAVRAIFFPGPCFREGIETNRIMEQEVRIYNAPKTVIDCFRRRKTEGLDMALEAARSYLKQRGVKPLQADGIREVLLKNIAASVKNRLLAAACHDGLVYEFNN